MLNDDNEEWVLSWQAPSDFESCGGIDYQIELNGEEVMLQSVTTFTIPFSDLNNCADNTVDITPIILAKHGKSNSITKPSKLFIVVMNV